MPRPLIKKITPEFVEGIRHYRLQPNLASNDGSNPTIVIPVGECKAGDIVRLELNANVQNTSGVAKTLKYTIVSKRTTLAVTDVSTIASGSTARIRSSFEFKCTGSQVLGQYAPFHVLRSSAIGTPAVGSVAAQLYGDTAFNVFPNDNVSLSFNIAYTLAGGILVDFTKAFASVIRSGQRNEL